MTRKSLAEEAAEVRRAWDALGRALAETLRLDRIVPWLDRQCRAHPVLSWVVVVLLAALIVAPFVLFGESVPQRWKED